MSERFKLRGVSPRDGEIVYGPVLSRRLGYSLGVNLNLRRGKTCTFDCVYCQYGRTINLVSSSEELADWLDEETILEEVRLWLRRLIGESQKLNSITFSGYGEPTLHPGFGEIARGVRGLRDELYPGVRVDILTNASTVTDRRVRDALREMDAVVAKLDAGTQEIFEAVNRPAEGVETLEDIVRSLAELHDETGRVTLQTLIFRSASPSQGDNASADELESIAEAARSIDPVEVQVYTVSRHPLEPFVGPAEEDTLKEAARRINSVIGRKCAKIYI
ncbi:hypothetical protein AC482_06520 [miscellaneous Crenarchaeota group-15 archaeon DG-45]|uniref:Radical SAM core domain-containing protein n=1 Tax=miscellaneous Crenarchaeota group-15 archaeon DG-45 TaxID=1685127 RepID=A0A0M0BLX4_9ARCH|nr:MAG: hypothetical protein AC482_06520 [miscellaneous Crenarchaeota group-15 archaeon DG-45]